MSGSFGDARNIRRKFFLMAVACAGANAFSQIASWMSPNILSAALTGLGFSPSEAGALLAGEFLAISVTSILLANYVAGIAFRSLVFGGALLALLAHFFSWKVTTFEAMLALRVLAGIGEGAVSMAANSLAGEFDRPDRLYGFMNLVAVMIGAIVMFLFPLVVGHFHGSGSFIFLYVGVVCVLLVPTFWWFSGRSVPRTHYIEGGGNRNTLSRSLAWLACVMIPLASAPLYTFAVELGQAVGMAEGTVSNYLTLSILLSLLGTGFVAFIGTRLAGRTTPMLTAIAIAMIAIAWQATGTAAGFKACLLAIMFAAYVAFPLLLGQLAEIDTSGRSSAIGVGLFGGAFAMGPIIAGALVEHSGLRSVPWFCLAVYGLVLVTVLGLRRASCTVQASVAV